VLVGYARTSTHDQVAGLESQVRELAAFGCTEIFREHCSAVAKRDELEKALQFIRKGDQLVCVSLSRLARSVPDLIKITATIESKGASLVIRDMGVDTSTPTGKLLLSLTAAIATFEREQMLERQKIGISAAKAQGKYKGRAPTALAKSAEVIALHGEGIGASEVALRLGISRASVYRIIGSHPKKAAAA
jgi:DNA invertase Pin-like site-specific DNA recombinase